MIQFLKNLFKSNKNSNSNSNNAINVVNETNQKKGDSTFISENKTRETYFWYGFSSEEKLSQWIHDHINKIGYWAPEHESEFIDYLLNKASSYLDYQEKEKTKEINHIERAIKPTIGYNQNRDKMAQRMIDALKIETKGIYHLLEKINQRDMEFDEIKKVLDIVRYEYKYHERSKVF
jgi:hypothetical protein